MLGVSLQNTTTDDFAFQLSARYLAFDVFGSGSELRMDGTAGAEPSVFAELYRPFGRTPLFVVGTAGARRETLSFVSEDIVTARYKEDKVGVGLAVGANLGRDSDVRLGVWVGDLSANVQTGNPGLPALNGRENRARLAWRFDGQDSTVAPSSGIRATARLDHILESPDVPPEFITDRSNDDVTQLELRSSVFWSVLRRDRVFLAGGAGTTWTARARIALWRRGRFRGRTNVVRSRPLRTVRQPHRM